LSFAIIATDVPPAFAAPFQGNCLKKDSFYGKPGKLPVLSESGEVSNFFTVCQGQKGGNYGGVGPGLNNILVRPVS
jgi:hypothetical protein